MLKNQRIVLFTNDVETTSLVNGGLRPETGVKVLQEGMPRLLDMYQKYNVKATFFFVANFAKEHPEIIKMIQPFGHEVACHGLTHDHLQAFDVLGIDQQKNHLITAKKILEDIAGEEVVSFRAPALRVNKNFPQVLAEAGFKIDSSVASQRMDMFMSFGIANKMNWITAPRHAYFVDEENIFKCGKSELFEIPISAMGLPYIGTFMRLAPGLNRFVRNLLFLETKVNGRQFAFLTHPNEFIDEKEIEERKIQRRTRSYVSYLLGDVLRYKMKLKNLGSKALPILEKEIVFFHNHDFNFMTCKELYEVNKNSKR